MLRLFVIIRAKTFALSNPCGGLLMLPNGRNATGFIGRYSTPFAALCGIADWLSTKTTSLEEFDRTESTLWQESVERREMDERLFGFGVVFLESGGDGRDVMGEV